VLHLAAQALVRASYAAPLDTYATNVMGTAHVLDALRGLPGVRVALVVTTDKVYRNREWVYPYREDDALGGHDPYSASKAAAEIVAASYRDAFLSAQGVAVATARAGNVIGGGDWAPARLLPDAAAAWSAGQTLVLRNPHATRPWQHVLEPLSGYLTLGAALAAKRELHGEAFNFGPRAEQNRTVLELVQEMAVRWGGKNEAVNILERKPFHEAGLLKLNCDKALFYLHWEANLEYRECIRFIADWYGSYYKRSRDMYALTLDQIADYEGVAARHGRVWAGT